MLKNERLTMSDVAGIYKKSLEDESYYADLIRAYNKFTQDANMEVVGDKNGR